MLAGVPLAFFCPQKCSLGSRWHFFSTQKCWRLRCGQVLGCNSGIFNKNRLFLTKGTGCFLLHGNQQGKVDGVVEDAFAHFLVGNGGIGDGSGLQRIRLGKDYC